MDAGWFPVVSSLLLGIISVALVNWLLLQFKSANCYREFDLLPRYGTLYTSTYEIIAPILFTKRTLPMNAMLHEKISGICALANGEPMIRSDFAFTRHLVVLKASTAKHVLMDKENVQKNSQLYHFLKEFLGSGLVTSDQAIWRERKKKLAPTLHTKIVGSYFKIFYENSLTLTSKLADLAGQTNVLMDKGNVQKTSQLYHFFKEFLGTGLITSDQEIWRDRRKKLAPTLHSKIIESYFHIFYENSLTLTSKLANLSGKTVDIMSIVGFCTLDIILETSTGIKMGIQKNEDSEYLRSIHTLKNASIERIYTPWYWLDCTYKLFPEGKKFFKALKYSREFSMKVSYNQQGRGWYDREAKYQRENEEVGSKMRGISFLDMVLELHLLDKNFSLHDVQSEIMTLIAAGYETTSVNISFVLFLLGLDPTRLGKVHEELDAVLGTNRDSPVELDQIKDLTYLECVIKETARLYPPAPVIARTLQTDVRIGDLLIPKGTSSVFSIHSIHRDPDVYPDPEKFNPERFLPDAEKPIDPIAYLPFSLGPRNCIGFKFAMLSMKVILSTILRRFSVESLVHRDKVVMEIGITQTPIDGFPIRFHPRSLP